MHRMVAAERIVHYFFSVQAIFYFAKIVYAIHLERGDYNIMEDLGFFRKCFGEQLIPSEMNQCYGVLLLIYD